MPKAAHAALEAEAKKKGLKGEEADRYVYGGLKKLEKGNAGKAARHAQHGQSTHEPQSRGMDEG